MRGTDNRWTTRVPKWLLRNRSSQSRLRGELRALTGAGYRPLPSGQEAEKVRKGFCHAANC